MNVRRVGFATAALALSFSARPAFAQEAPAAPAEKPAAEVAKAAPGPTEPPDDGWPDMSSFLDEKYGFLPIVMPITEPAVGYGAGGGLTFISKPLGAAARGLGRPNITFVGGFGTANGSWGVAAMDMRYWLDDRVQTLAGAIYASVNLDWHGLGKTELLENSPLRYNLEPKAGAIQGKYRFGDTRLWAGMAYVLAVTTVSFEAPAGTPGLPDFERTSRVGGVIPAVSLDTRDNFFTPLHGSFVEASFGVFAKWLGSSDNFERASLVGIQYFPLPHRLYLGFRGDAAASFGNAPFYLRPSISMRGVAAMRYQGEEIAQAQAELRWQFWKRWSILGFVGGGGAWNDFENFESTQGVVAGGGGFRYELARRYGIHAGVDVAGSKDTAAFYIQVGSAWMRP
jgi:hypothetical protein